MPVLSPLARQWLDATPEEQQCAARDPRRPQPIAGHMALEVWSRALSATAMTEPQGMGITTALEVGLHEPRARGTACCRMILPRTVADEKGGA